MKASITFPDDPKSPPLVRAKVPIAVLGLPFVAGLSSSDGGPSLRLDLSTAFPAGPSLRFSYRPNDTLHPFSLSLKTGAGPLGSPSRSPFSLSAHLSLLPTASGLPAFSLILRPKFGDFSLRKSLRSADLDYGTPAVPEEKSPSFENGTDAPIVGIRPIDSAGMKNVGLARDAVAGFFSGMQLSASSAIPVWNRAVVNCKWGLRVPMEPKGFLSESDGREGKLSRIGASVAKLPMLVLKKISVEQLPQQKSCEEEQRAKGVAMEEFSLMKHQLQLVQVESAAMRRAIEELESEIGYRGKRAMQGSLAPNSKADVPPASMVASRDTMGGSGKAQNEAARKSGEIGDELRKALEAGRK